MPKFKELYLSEVGITSWYWHNDISSLLSPACSFPKTHATFSDECNKVIKANSSGVIVGRLMPLFLALAPTTSSQSEIAYLILLYTVNVFRTSSAPEALDVASGEG